MIEIPIQSGFILAFYLAYQGVFLLSILDSSISRVLSYSYYRRIFAGKPLLSRSCDIPGVTSYHVGRWLSLPNLISLFIKCLFIGLILFLDLNVIAVPRKEYEVQRHTGTFLMDPSEGQWSTDIPLHRVVTRRWDQVRACKIVEGKNVTFFHISFNLSDGAILESEIMQAGAPYINIDDESLLCMSNEVVEKPWVIAEVIGCSSLGRKEQSECLYKNSVLRPAKLLPFDGSHQPFFVTRFDGIVYDIPVYRFNEEEIISVLPEYELSDTDGSIDMICQQMMFSKSKDSRDGMLKSSCLIVRIENNNTLIERWEHDTKLNTIERQYAGPVFFGKLDIGVFQKSNFLWNLREDSNWITMSSAIVAESSVYKSINQTTNFIKDEYFATQIPNRAIVVLSLMTLVIIGSRIIVALTVDRFFDRPQLNSVNGLSSIAREELEPSGASIVNGRTMHVGLMVKKNDMFHFGPLPAAEEAAVKPIKGVKIF